MLYGNFPFHADAVEDLERLVLEGNYSLSEGISEEAKDLLVHILDSDPDSRFTIKDICNHMWMQDINSSCNCLSHISTVVH
jgi:serine/threonine protein kinase